MKLDVSPVAQLSKKERVELLLEHWQDFHETLHKTSHEHAGYTDEGTVIGMPRMYRHPSVVELRRCVELFKVHAPKRYWHFMQWYDPEWRTVTRTVEKRTKKGKREMVQVRQRERVKVPGVRRQKVESGVDFVTAAFRGPVSVPSELLEDIQQAA